MDHCWSTTPPPHVREHLSVVDQEFKTQFCRGHHLWCRRRQAHEPGRSISAAKEAKKNEAHPKMPPHGSQSREVQAAQ